jgi:hypothetical protein
MNLKTTLVLLVVVASGIGLWLVRSKWAGQLGLAHQAQAECDDNTVQILEDKLTLEDLKRIEIKMRDADAVVLERGANDLWTAPGHWPTRKPDVEHLVQLLTNLRSRFAPIPLDDGHLLKDYGLDKPAVVVIVTAGSDRYRLAFAEKDPPNGDADEEAADRLSQPTYMCVSRENSTLPVLSASTVGLLGGPSTPCALLAASALVPERVGKPDEPREVIRLAPGLVAALSRPADYYQQRRLFPFERVAKEGEESRERVEELKAKSITVTRKKDDEKKIDGIEYTLARTDEDTLKRTGERWQLNGLPSGPDRLDPEKRKTILRALPDLWAEQFVSKPEQDLARYGLKDPELTLRVIDEGGSPITLLIGAESPTKKERTVVRSMPAFGGRPPQQFVDKVEDRFRYAKLANNDQIFEIKDDKLKDLFVPASDLRDATLTRFPSRDATRLELEHGTDKFVLVKHKSKDKEGKEEERWRLEMKDKAGKPVSAPAESDKVADLLARLAALQARGKEEIRDKADAKVDGLDKPTTVVRVTFEEKISGDGEQEKRKPPLTRTLTVGKHDTDKKKLYVRDDWRINVVEDSLAPLLERPATAYRGRRVLDFADKDVDEIEVDRNGKKEVALKQKDGAWKLTAPSAADADSVRARQLAADLGRLEAVEYVNDAPTTKQLDEEYGLSKPAVEVRLKFTGDKSAEKLLIGKQRAKKQEFFAKRAADSAVFVVRQDIRDALDKDALAYLPLQIWQLALDDIVALNIHKEGQDAYTLTKKVSAWRIAGPFGADATTLDVRPMVQELANLRCERYVAQSTKELAKYGLDKPYLTVVLTAKEGAAAKEHTLLIGKPTGEPVLAPPPPDGLGLTGAPRFAKSNASDAVFVVSGRLLTAVDKAALDLLSRDLLNLDPNSITRIQNNAGGKKLTLVKQDKAWKVIESAAGQPYTADDLTALRTAFACAHPPIDRFAAYDPPKTDLKKFGLDPPAWTVTITVQPPDVDGKPAKPVEHTIVVGQPVEVKKAPRYARIDNGPGVVVLGAGAVAELGHEYLAFVDHALLKVKPGDVTALVRRMGNDDLEIAKRDDGWRLLKPADQQADEQTVQALLEQLAKARASTISAYPAKDLKPFGLDKPVAVVTLRLSADGKKTQQVLKIGKVVDEERELGQPAAHFVQVEGSSAVGVLPAHLAQSLLAGPLAFRDRSLAHFADADRVILKRGPRSAVFTKVDGTWKLTKPLETDAEHQDLDDFVNAVAKLRAAELVSDKAKPTADELKKFGLDKPVTHWSFLSGDKEVLGLYLGTQPALKGGGKDPRCYARMASSDLIFLLDASLTRQALAEYRSRTLWTAPLDAAQADLLSYKHGDKSFVLEKGTVGWQVAGKTDVKIDTKAVNAALAALAGLKPERFVVDKDADLKLYGLDPPELVIEAQTPNGRRLLHVGRIEGDSKRYYARVPTKDSTSVFVISEADAAKLVRQLAGFTAK